MPDEYELETRFAEGAQRIITVYGRMSGETIQFQAWSRYRALVALMKLLDEMPDPASVTTSILYGVVRTLLPIYGKVGTAEEDIATCVSMLRAAADVIEKTGVRDGETHIEVDDGKTES